MKRALCILTILLLLPACGQKKPTEAEATKRLQEFAEALSYGKLDKARELIADGGVDVNKIREPGGYTCLHWAVQNADLETMKLLIKAGADLNAKDEEGRTSLHYVGSLDRAKLLLAAGANVNAKANDGTTALTEAARCGNLEVVRLFLSYKADVNLKDSRGATALDTAIDNSLPQVILLLREHGAKTQKVPLNIIEAVRFGDKDKVTEFAQTGSEADGKSADTEREWTPLHETAKFGDKDILLIVLAYSADVNARGVFDADKVTPLHIACDSGHTEIVRTLLTHGAQVDAKTDFTEQTPLHLAVSKGHKKVVELLLSEGGSINAAMCNGSTALDLTDDDEMKQLLRRYGAVSGTELEQKEEK